MIQFPKGGTDLFDKGTNVPAKIPSLFRQCPHSFSRRWEQSQKVGFQVFSVDHARFARNNGRVGKDGETHKAQGDGLSVEICKEDHDQTVHDPQEWNDDDAKCEFFRQHDIVAVDLDLGIGQCLFASSFGIDIGHYSDREIEQNVGQCTQGQQYQHMNNSVNDSNALLDIFFLASLVFSIQTGNLIIAQS